MSDGNGLFMKIVAVISCIAAIFSAIFAFIQWGQKKAAIRDKQEAVIMAHEARRKLQIEKEIEKDNLRIFIREYRGYVSEIENCKNRYEKLDNIGLISEIGREEWERRRKLAFAELQNEISAFLDYIHKWRKVQSSLKGLINGIIDDLEISNRTKNESEIVKYTDIINKKLESDIKILEEALAKTSKS